jgi:hypothetical protein
MQLKLPLSSSTSAAMAASSSSLHVPAERFKEVCMRAGGECSQDANTILDFLFDPEKPLNTPKNDVEVIKNYLTGGASYDSFKTKSNYII